MEDDAIQVDSPEQDPVDLDDDDIEQSLILEDTPSPQYERQDPFDPKAGGSSEPRNKSLSPKSSLVRKRKRLIKPHEKPREEQLDYPESLPYETETLEEMDAKLEVIVRRLVDCVRAKD